MTDVDTYPVSPDDYFAGAYIDWRNKRIAKIESIFGKEFFNGKTLLELGCGYGHLGKYFHEELGSDVTFAEGNEAYISRIQHNNPNSEVLHLDQDKAYDLKKKFDVVIHFGVLYHLNDWKQDLKCALNHTDLMILESEVANSENPEFELKYIDHQAYDQAVNRIASRPSASYIESVLTEQGFTFVRYDDADLDSGFHRYSWTVNEGGPQGTGMRRFWIVRKA